LDFKGNAGRHRLVNTFDILSGAEDDRVKQRAQAIMDTDESTTILDAVAGAEREIALEHRRRLLFDVSARLVNVDLFAVLGIQPAPGRWGGAAITERQAGVLERNGIEAHDLDRGQASTLIETLVSRRNDGLCTYRQARTLLRHGYDPDVTFEEASALIAGLAANGWRRHLVATA